MTKITGGNNHVCMGVEQHFQNSEGGGEQLLVVHSIVPQNCRTVLVSTVAVKCLSGPAVAVQALSIWKGVLGPC